MTMLTHLRQILASEFSIDPDDIRPEADLVEDLDLDSIDAIDILARLREETGAELSADSLKNVRTVADFIGLIEAE
ncbi:MAG: acyl carrier protein [Pseudomonadaceae bacterium]|nr:acyl carrier protein [Pseudomonadaceae bacterium]